MNTGEKINQIRKMAGMTQGELAEKMNVSRQTISKWETGASSPDLESAIRLCRLFRISLDDFAEGGKATEQEEKISLQDMVKINRRTQRLTILLLSGLFFLLVGAVGALVIAAVSSTTDSIKYMLYRYIAVGEYANVPVDYRRLNAPIILLIAIGVILCAAYAFEVWKERRRENDKEKKQKK